MAKSSQSKTIERHPPSKTVGRRRAAARTIPVDPTLEAARLTGELEAARVRIAELEMAHKAVLDRIAWAVDSLHTLLEDAPD